MEQIEKEKLVKLIACDEVEEDFGAKIERNGAPRAGGVSPGRRVLCYR